MSRYTKDRLRERGLVSSNLERHDHSDMRQNTGTKRRLRRKVISEESRCAPWPTGGGLGMIAAPKGHSEWNDSTQRDANIGASRSYCFQS